MSLTGSLVLPLSLAAKSLAWQESCQFTAVWTISLDLRTLITWTFSIRCPPFDATPEPLGAGLELLLPLGAVSPEPLLLR